MTIKDAIAIIEALSSGLFVGAIATITLAAINELLGTGIVTALGVIFYVFMLVGSTLSIAARRLRRGLESEEVEAKHMSHNI